MDRTKRLAEFAAETGYKDLPKEVVEQAKFLILDTLGCAIGGYTLASEEVKWVLELVKNQGCTGGPSTVFCDGFKTTAAYAALANGAMVHTVDFDDTHMGSVAHLGASLVATIFALAEQRKAGGREMIEALVVGFDVGARVGRCAMPSHYKYWHPTATFGGIACAVAAAKLLGADAGQMELAIGHAADEAGGMRYCIEKGDFSKSLHPAFAAMKGVLLASIVKIGATGPRGFLEYPSGFCNAYSTSPNWNALTDGLGTKYEIMADTIKCFPTIQCSHTPIQATLDIMKSNKLKASDIESLHVLETETVPGQGCNYEPASPLAGRLSIPFCIGLAVTEGRVSLEQFTEDKIQDPGIREVMKKITIEADSEFSKTYPDTIIAHVDIKTRGGKTFSQSRFYPKGDPRNRMTPAELQAKFHQLASNTVDEKRMKQIITAIGKLEKTTDISKLIGLLVV
jgi:2-methylcitrate dehydratase PrpD